MGEFMSGTLLQLNTDGESWFGDECWKLKWRRFQSLVLKRFKAALKTYKSVWKLL